MYPIWLFFIVISTKETLHNERNIICTQIYSYEQENSDDEHKTNCLSYMYIITQRYSLILDYTVWIWNKGVIFPETNGLFQGLEDMNNYSSMSLIWAIDK